VTIPLEAIRGAYDAVARAYAERFRDELESKPLDRALLEVFAERVKGRGVVADLGTGPGHVARYLHRLGVEVVGVDLSPRMLEEARRLSGDLPITWRGGNLLHLDVPEGALAGVVAFYAHVHVPGEHLVGAFCELNRVLAAGAPALLAFHVGDDVLELDTWFDQPVRLDFHFHGWSRVLSALDRAGLTVEAKLERLPHVPLEHPSMRGYVLARRGG
jgi:SAM-dependent methyltransferase